MIPRCFLILWFVWLLSSAAPTAARSESPAPVDLAAMTLTPADLAAVGWTDLGLTSGQTLSVTDLADRAVWPAGAGEEQDAVRTPSSAPAGNRGTGPPWLTLGPQPD